MSGETAIYYPLSARVTGGGATNAIGAVVSAINSVSFPVSAWFPLMDDVFAKPRYRVNAHIYIAWNGSEWQIVDSQNEGVLYSSTEDVDTPDLVTSWTDEASLGGAPEVFLVFK